MATNPITPEQRKIVSVEILHLDEKGYGPKGEHTRREWRKECLDNLLAGKVQFEAWQASWKDKVVAGLRAVSLASKLTYDDGNSEVVLDGSYGTTTPTTLDFVAHTFEQDVDAFEFTFKGVASFSSATFSGYANFSSATFSGYANFSSATFSGDVFFSGVKFSGNAFFSSATFSGYAFFSSATFSDYAFFNGAMFSGNAFFNSATFSGNAFFRSTAFSGDAYFSSATFSGNADYRSTAFSGDADFSSAAFSGNADFQSATFFRDANFFKVIFKNQCRFDNEQDDETKVWEEETSFGGKVDFENATFDNVGHFERVQFLIETPKFRGCKIGDTRLEFSDDSYFPQDEKGEDAVKNISFLKRLAEEHGQTEQALNFNAMELKAKAASDNASWNFKIVTWLYNHVSDFGRSFLRPLTVYAIILFITFLIALEHSAFNAPRNYTQNGCEKYVWWIERVTWVGDKNCQRSEKFKEHKLNGIRAAGEYTLYRAVGVLDFADSDKQTIEVANRLFAQDYEPWWMRIYGIFKAIASTALLFLAALGLRNKYRIK